jgi:hypothetical protein
LNQFNFKISFVMAQVLYWFLMNWNIILKILYFINTLKLQILAKNCKVLYCLFIFFSLHLKLLSQHTVLVLKFGHFILDSLELILPDLFSLWINFLDVIYICSNHCNIKCCSVKFWRFVSNSCIELLLKLWFLLLLFRANLISLGCFQNLIFLLRYYWFFGRSF